MPRGQRSAGRCEVCDREALTFLRHSSVWQFDVVRCRNCGIAYVRDAAANLQRAQDAADEPIAWTDYTRCLRGDEPMRRDVLARIKAMLPARAETPLLFDVGTGAGEFLTVAESVGFAGTGNDISPSAIRHAQEEYGREVSDRPLAEQPAGACDAITMWCVLAHVPDPLEFLREAHAMLRPGGVLFLRTPRWCVLDTIGMSAARLSGDRLSGLAERRVTQSHMHLYTRRALAMHLGQAGFTDLTVEARCDYPFVTAGYLHSVGGKAKLLAPLTPVLDGLIARGWFARNALMAYARRRD